jgi:hypothetical protein
VCVRARARALEQFECERGMLFLLVLHSQSVHKLAHNVETCLSVHLRISFPKALYVFD